MLRFLGAPVWRCWLGLVQVSCAEPVRSSARHSCRRRAVWSREVADHRGTGVAGDDPSVTGEIHTGKIRAGIYQSKYARPGILGHVTAAQKRFGVAVHTDACAARVAARAVTLHDIRAGEICLAVGVDVYTGAAMTGNLRAVEKRRLTPETHENADWSVAVDDVGITGEPE